MSGQVRLAMRLAGSVLCTLAVAVCVGLGLASPAAAAAPHSAAGCDVIHSLTLLDREQRQTLHQACENGPKTDADTYSALFRLVSSSGWHAGVVDNILSRSGRSSLTVWADGETRDPPAAIETQKHIDAGLPSFAAGARCGELRDSEELAAFIDAIEADEPPEASPFTSRFATCLGVAAPDMEGTRLLTIRADGLEKVTVVVGTSSFVYARQWSRADALHLGGHRFFVVAVPEASPVVVFGAHENQALPVVWRGLVARNLVVWAAPPRRSCLDLSVRMNAGTHLYFDGVRIDGGRIQDVCAAPTTDASHHRPTSKVDRTLAVTLDQPGSGLPEHEIAALTCEGSAKRRRPVVRHLSPLPATADQLRAADVCEALQLDLGTPTKQRVAVLGVTKLPGCEATPMWASDVQERVRHVLGRDAAHRKARTYANFSAYAEASEALSTLESRLGGPRREPEQGADANMLLGSAAQEAWRQGIDTLLSFAVQCTPRGVSKGGEPQWAYSIRATSIGVGELFARGYYGRDGLDLEAFISVESVGFDAAEQQDASIGALLDRVFEVNPPRVTHPPSSAPYRRPQTLQLSGYYDEPPSGEPSKGDSVPEAIKLHFKPFHPVGRHMFDLDPRRGTMPDDRPRLCDALVQRGARPPEAIEKAGEEYRALGDKEYAVTLQRSREDVDSSANPRATVHKGDLFVPRPGWYLVAVDADEDGQVDDAVCINATAHAVDVWADFALSGGPLAFAKNGSRSQLYLRPRLGATWYLRGGWLGSGLTLGYAFSDYAGTRGDWKDLDVSVKDPLRWRRHALLLAPHVELRSRATVLPVEFRARAGIAFDGGLVDLSRVDDDLLEFRTGRADDTILDIDGDVNLDLSIGAPVGAVQIQTLVMLTYVAFDDAFARTATTVAEDANLYIGFGFAISGGRR